MLFAAVLSGLFFSNGTSQINDPVPEKIMPADFSLVLRDFVQLPSTSQVAPRARINMLREVDDGTGRLFVNDLQGLLYSISGTSWDLYLNLRGAFPDFISGPGKGTGFGAFAFHPEFRDNGKFYTSHAETGGAADADFTPVAYDHIALQWAVYEWIADDPLATAFSGTKRELLRADFPDVLHGFQDIAFNPTAEPGDADYGMLYICIGDGGSSLNFYPENLQEVSSYLGTIFRIDPMGDNSVNGAYGIPADNPFAGDDNATQEIWVRGFRNPHRICWDPAADHKMLIGDIGEMNIEEVNIGVKGSNYGWSEREGTFLYNRALGRENVYPLPPDDSINNYTYPVAMYDHDEGNAIVGGYVYRGDRIPELNGKYIFGDIVNGRTFIVDANELEEGQLQMPQELFLSDTLGNVIDLQQLENNGRADLRFGYDLEGNIYVLTKADGFVRTLHSTTSSATSEQHRRGHRKFHVYPNPVRDIVSVSTVRDAATEMHVTIYNAVGRQVIYKHAHHHLQFDLSSLEPGLYVVCIRSGGDSHTGKLVIAR